jgi:hypothetical protein
MDARNATRPRQIDFNGKKEESPVGAPGGGNYAVSAPGRGNAKMGFAISSIAASLGKDICGLHRPQMRNISYGSAESKVYSKLPIQQPILHGFGDVIFVDLVGTIDISNRPRDSADFIIRTGAQAHFIHRLLHQ